MKETHPCQPTRPQQQHRKRTTCMVCSIWGNQRVSMWRPFRSVNLNDDPYPQGELLLNSVLWTPEDVTLCTCRTGSRCSECWPQEGWYDEQAYYSSGMNGCLAKLECLVLCSLQIYCSPNSDFRTSNPLHYFCALNSSPRVCCVSKYIYGSYVLRLCEFLEYKTWYRLQTRPSHTHALSWALSC